MEADGRWLLSVADEQIMKNCLRSSLLVCKGRALYSAECMRAPDEVRVREVRMNWKW